MRAEGVRVKVTHHLNALSGDADCETSWRRQTLRVTVSPSTLISNVQKPTIRDSPSSRTRRTIHSHTGHTEPQTPLCAYSYTRSDAPEPILWRVQVFSFCRLCRALRRWERRDPRRRDGRFAFRIRSARCVEQQFRIRLELRSALVEPRATRHRSAPGASSLEGCVLRRWGWGRHRGRL